MSNNILLTFLLCGTFFLIVNLVLRSYIGLYIDSLSAITYIIQTTCL